MSAEGGDRLYVFTSNLVEVFRIRQTILGKLDLQKTAYLMKRLGAEVPFDFRWNILGPYSYDLAHYCSHLEAEGLLIYTGDYSLDEERATSYVSRFSVEMTNKLTRFFRRMENICEENGYDRVRFIECVASLDFLRQNVLNVGADRDSIFDLLERLKPDRTRMFQMMQSEAWNFLMNEGLIE